MFLPLIIPLGLVTTIRIRLGMKTGLPAWEMMVGGCVAGKIHYPLDCCSHDYEDWKDGMITQKRISQELLVPLKLLRKSKVTATVI